jgi:hypothetical protein
VAIAAMLMFWALVNVAICNKGQRNNQVSIGQAFE